MEKSESTEYNIGEIISDLFILKQDVLSDTIKDLEALGLGKHTETVLDPLWKFGFCFVPEGFLAVEHKRHCLAKLDEIKDWRNIVREIVSLPPSEKY